MPLHADLSCGAPGCVLAPPAPALRGPHHSRLWASPSSASANARGAPRLRARISLSSWSTLASVRRSCSPDGTEALAGDRRSVWDLSSVGVCGGLSSPEQTLAHVSQADPSPELLQHPWQPPELLAQGHGCALPPGPTDRLAHSPHPDTPAAHLLSLLPWRPRLANPSSTPVLS